MNNELERKCPKCCLPIFYTCKLSCLRAEDKKSLCFSCASTKSNFNKRKYDYENHFDKDKNKYFYNCSKCNKKFFVKGKRGLRQALQFKENYTCRSCKSKYSLYLENNCYVIKCVNCYEKIKFKNTWHFTSKIIKKVDNVLCVDCKENKMLSELKINFDSTNNLWIRPCHDCKTLLTYKSKASIIASARKNTKCKKCVVKLNNTKYTNYDAYFNAEKNVFFKNCPKCNCILEYSGKDGLRSSIKNNQQCYSCFGLSRKLIGFDKYHDVESKIWEKECPQCKNNIMYYKEKCNLIRSIKNNFVCKNCVKYNKYSRNRDHKAYDTLTKKWIKKCYLCSKDISYPKFSIYTNSVKNNFKCRSCTNKEISSRPEIRMLRSNNLKKTILKKSSKKELELFNLIENLGFIHNGKNINSKIISGYFPDIIHSKYKLIVEFYGDRWHANPNVDRFSKDETIIPLGKNTKSAKEIRDRDKIRQSALENEGYKVIIIWENSFDKKNNKELIYKNIENEIKDIKIIC